MAVRIRMKQMGRKHRPFYRICAMDARVPRDGRMLEQLGTYDPMVPETDARAILNTERIQHWLNVGALPTEKVRVLIKKYGPGGTHLEAQRLALARLAQVRRRNEPLQVEPKAAKAPKAKEETPAKQPAAEDAAPTEAEADTAETKE
ncbi:MAG: 30S ribosomal protein S16 [Pirellulales bacterium]|nr:30S ribosomal protein S16 [Pirellulales bacterium]